MRDLLTIDQAREIECQQDLPELVADIHSNTLAEQRGWSTGQLERHARKLRAAYIVRSLELLDRAMQCGLVKRAGGSFIETYIRSVSAECDTTYYWCCAESRAVDWGHPQEPCETFLFHEAAQVYGIREVGE